MMSLIRAAFSSDLMCCLPRLSFFLPVQSKPSSWLRHLLSFHLFTF
jgi:hypothetical protein